MSDQVKIDHVIIIYDDGDARQLVGDDAEAWGQKINGALVLQQLRSGEYLDPDPWQPIESPVEALDKIAREVACEECTASDVVACVLSLSNQLKTLELLKDKAPRYDSRTRRWFIPHEPGEYESAEAALRAARSLVA